MMASTDAIAPATTLPSTRSSTDIAPAAAATPPQMTKATMSQEQRSKRLGRPPIGSRKSSGTIIVPRDSPSVEIKDEHYDDNDARAMSPRRSSVEIERLSKDAKDALTIQAQTLQDNLMEIVQRVDSVKTEHEKLEGGNKFLQSYIGELMQTSKLTSVGPAKKGRGRTGK